MLKNGSEWMDQCANFEHVTYLPEDLVEHLLIKHGFNILEKKYFLDDHSIFYAVIKQFPILN